MRNVHISVERNSKSGILCTVARKLRRRPAHILALMQTSIIETYCVSFLKKKCDPFFRIKVYMQEGSPKKVFSIERHYNVGLKMVQY